MSVRKNQKIIKQLASTERAHDWFGLSRESLADSDRGCALMLGAFLDIHLEKLLRSVLLQQKSVVDPLFQYPGALSTFSAKIRLAYCLRLLHEHEYRDLNRILKIRNGFAHELHGISFSKDPVIAKLCRSLESRKIKGLPTEGISNRWLFWLTAYSIASNIDNRSLDQETEERIAARPVFREPPMDEGTG
jgi:hypothetical protein